MDRVTATEGRRARGRQKTTWSDSVEKERNKAGRKSRKATRNRECWSENVMALSSNLRDGRR